MRRMKLLAACALGMALLARAEPLPSMMVPALTTTPGPLAQRAYELTRREITAIRHDLLPWAQDPRAKLLTTGKHDEHGIRPNTQVMLAFVVVARWGATPAERANALADLVALLRFVAPTHSAGPLMANDGKKWQAQWQSALWAFQAGQAAWLVWDKLDAELQAQLANMLAVEADRFLTWDPPHQVKNDTKAEENAWDSLVVALAACMLPQHPHAAAWHTAAQRWQLSSFLTEADTRSDRGACAATFRAENNFRHRHGAASRGLAVARGFRAAAAGDPSCRARPLSHHHAHPRQQPLIAHLYKCALLSTGWCTVSSLSHRGRGRADPPR
jgi:hypothetical protein